MKEKLEKTVARVAVRKDQGVIARQDVKAYILDEGVVLHKAVDGNDWMITHTRTGRSIQGGFRTRSQATEAFREASEDHPVDWLKAGRFLMKSDEAREFKNALEQLMVKADHQHTNA